jgi:hypothetical protein
MVPYNSVVVGIVFKSVAAGGCPYLTQILAVECSGRGSTFKRRNVGKLESDTLDC